MNSYLFKPIQTRTTNIYMWLVSQPKDTSISPWVYCITADTGQPSVIRQGRRYSPMAYYTKVTNGHPVLITTTPTHEAEALVRGLREELLHLGISLFDSQGEYEMRSELSYYTPAPSTHYLDLYPDIPLTTAPHELQAQVFEQVQHLIKQAENNRKHVSKHRSKGRSW